MPVSKDNKARYPANWASEIRPAIMARAGEQCEYTDPLTGRRCEATHHAVGWWEDGDTRFHAVERQDASEPARHRCQEETTPEHKAVWIILTIAHLHDPDPANVDPGNLAALCQRHHNRRDALDRARNAVQTKQASGPEAERVLDPAQPPQVLGAAPKSEYRQRFRLRINELLREAADRGMTAGEALFFLDQRGGGGTPHIHQMWLAERKLARVALGLLAPSATPRKTPSGRKPAAAVADGQLSLLEI